MARIQFGGLVDGVLGSIGGITFSVNRAGFYAKARRASTNPRSSTQSTVRRHLSAYPTLWRILTDPQRADWNTWAAAPEQDRIDYWGNTYHLTGFQAFVWINQCRWTTFDFPAVLPPTDPQPPAPTMTSADVGFMPQAFCLLTWPTDEFATYHAVFRHAVQDVQTNDVFPYSHAIITLALQRPVHATFHLEDDIEDHFGVFSPGQRLWTQAARQTTEGYRSPWVTLHGDF